MAANLDLKIFYDHPQWPEIKAISQKLIDAGYEAVLAGGCVRDLLMRVVPHDFDIATNATPDQVLKIFPQALTVGREFGVIILAFDGFQIEIASFRTDGEYRDGRRPESIQMATDKEDAKRRDFTINALFFNFKTEKIIDYVDGQKDIEAKLIQCVGEPVRRFGEDKLRMLRAVRFAGQLGFRIEAKTLAAVEAEHKNIKLVAMERIRDELAKLFNSKDIALGLTPLRSTGLLFSIHPLFEPYRDETLWQTVIQRFKAGSSESLIAKFCAFFKDLQGPPLELALKQLKFPNAQVKSILWCFSSLEVLRSNQRLAEKIKIVAHFDLMHLLQYAGLTIPKEFTRLEKEVTELQASYLEQGSLPRPWVEGEDLVVLGLSPGPVFAKYLREIYDLQLEKKLRTKSEALEYLGKMKA